MPSLKKKKKKARNLKRARVESPKATSAPGPAARPVVQHEFLIEGNARLFIDGEADSFRIDQIDASINNETATANSAWMAVMAGSGVISHGSTELISRQLDLVDTLLPNATVQFAIRVAPPVHNSQTRVGDAEILNSNPKDERRQEELLSEGARNRSDTEFRLWRKKRTIKKDSTDLRTRMSSLHPLSPKTPGPSKLEPDGSHRITRLTPTN